MPTTLGVIQGSFEELWQELILFLPHFAGAIAVLLVGMLISITLGKVVIKIVAMLRLDEFALKLEVKQALQKIGVKLHIGHLLGWTIKWFCLIVFLIAATDILGWDQVTDYLKQVVFYIPNVIIAVIILLAGILLGTFVHNVIRSAVEAAHISCANFLASLAKWAIIIFSLMAAFVQLQIAQELIRILFTGFVAMLALAGGLAFGLGGREHAARFLDRLRKDISSNE